MKLLLSFFDKLIVISKKLPILNKLPESFFKFFIVGATGFILDFIIFNTLYYIFNFRATISLFQITPEFTFTLSLTNLTAVALGSIWGFIMNKNWSFENKSAKVAAQYSKYLAVAIFNNLLNNLLFGTLMFGIFSADQRGQFLLTSTAKVLATSFQVITSYFLYKFVVFRQDKEVLSEALTVPTEN